MLFYGGIFKKENYMENKQDINSFIYGAIMADKIYGANHYSRLDVVIAKAQGSWLTDVAGNRYLDCLAAYSAANLGHNHPHVVNSIGYALTQNTGSVISNVVYNMPLSIFLNKLAIMVPQLGPTFGAAGNKVLPKNGGVESVETAIKAMRYYGWALKGIEDGKQEIIVFDNSFHGRTTTVVSASTTDPYSKGFGGRSELFKSVPFGDIKAVERAVTANTCGILVEPYEGEGGMNIPPKGFLKGLRKLADDNNIMLVFDEIQVGLGRTGRTFCFEHENVVPDGLILGKALSGGLLPLSVFMTNSALMDIVFRPGTDGSTFGGYPLACIAGIAALTVLETENLARSSRTQGAKLKKEIEEIAERSPHVKEVRGKGLFIGIEVKEGNAMDFCRKLMGLGVVANDSHGHTIRISPPLNITDEEIDFLLENLKKVLI
jgi:ornithine--oxo-acid transaminase